MRSVTEAILESMVLVCKILTVQVLVLGLGSMGLDQESMGLGLESMGLGLGWRRGVELMVLVPVPVLVVRCCVRGWSPSRLLRAWCIEVTRAIA